MKTFNVKLIAILLMACMLIPIFASCSSDSTITPIPSDSGTTNEGHNAIYFKTLTVDENNVACCKVPNGTQQFNFANEIEVKGTARYNVYLDKHCSQVLKDRTVPLVSGDNTFYICAKNTDKGEVIYTATIRVKPLYEVTFDTAGGTEVEAQLIEEDAFATPPTTAKIGYTFAAWNFDFATPITANTNIVASWTAKSDTIILDNNGGEGGVDRINVTFDVPMPAITAPTRDGYIFLGYYDAANGGIKYYNDDLSSARNWDKTESVTLYAQWQIATYTVTFIPNGATAGTMAVQKYRYGEKVNLPINDFEKTDYVFGGWSGSDNKKYTNAQEILINPSDFASLELTAIWLTSLGFDISMYQAGMTISSMKDYDIGFLILRGGYTGYGTGETLNKDPNFEGFYEDAKALGIPVGAYWYSCANTYQKGWNEAKYMYENCLQGKSFELPIFIDVEETRWQGAGLVEDSITYPGGTVEGVTAAINGFCDYMYSKNMYPAIYTYVSFCQYMDIDEIAAKYDIGIAAYDVDKAWVDQYFPYGAYEMWQWTSRYEGNHLDANYIYRDYETFIKRFGLNGFTATDPNAEFKTNIQLAQEVIAGKWGTGVARKIALTAAGYDYTSVQDAVGYLLT